MRRARGTASLAVLAVLVAGPAFGDTVIGGTDPPGPPAPPTDPQQVVASAQQTASDTAAQVTSAVTQTISPSRGQTPPADTQPAPPATPPGTLTPAPPQRPARRVVTRAPVARTVRHRVVASHRQPSGPRRPVPIAARP